MIEKILVANSGFNSVSKSLHHVFQCVAIACSQGIHFHSLKANWIFHNVQHSLTVGGCGVVTVNSILAIDQVGHFRAVSRGAGSYQDSSTTKRICDVSQLSRGSELRLPYGSTWPSLVPAVHQPNVSTGDLLLPDAVGALTGRHQLLLLQNQADSGESSQKRQSADRDVCPDTRSHRRGQPAHLKEYSNYIFPLYITIAPGSQIGLEPTVVYCVV